MFDQHPLDAHICAVDATGVDPPAEWTALHERLQTYLGEPSPIIARLADSVISGTDDVAILRAAALAEATALPPARAEVDHVVATTVLARLLDLYAPVALDTDTRGVDVQWSENATADSFGKNLVSPVRVAMRVEQDDGDQRYPERP